MSSRLAAARPFLGVLALASILALTACSGGRAEQPGASTGNGTSSPASAEATAETSAETSAEPAADAAPGSTGGPGAPSPTEEPDGEPAREPADEPVQSPAAEDPAAPPAAGTPAEVPAADGAVSAPHGGAAGGGTSGSEGTSRWCTTSQLEVAAAPAGGAAGSVWVELTATNTGGNPCTLAGYPGVSFVDSSGALIGLPAVRDTSTPGTGQLVAPGQSVTAALRVGQAANHPACDARAAAGLRVYPPESTESVVIPFPAQACADTRVQQLEIQGLGA